MRNLTILFVVAAILVPAFEAAGQRRGSRDRRGYGRSESDSRDGGRSSRGFRGGGPSGLDSQGGGPSGMGFRGGGPPGMDSRGGGSPGMGFRGGGPPGMGSRGGGPPGMGFRGGGPPGMDSRWGGPPGMRDRGRDSRGDRSSRFEGFLRSMDANHNGMLEPSEVPEERQRMLRYMADRMGIDPSKPISLDQVGERMRRRDGDEGGGSGKSGEPEPLVPGFGEEQELARVPAFGERVEFTLPGSSLAESALAKLDPERASRVRGFADAMFSRLDQNRNGILDKEEWEDSRFTQGADGNDDGKVTKDELIVAMAEFSGRRGPDRDRDSDRDSDDSDDSDSDDSNGRRSFRFRRTAELLPPGLPDWFARYDVNADGQVAMVEYSTSWSDDDVRRFQRYDLNGDGLITPSECLGASSTGGLADAGGPSGGPGGPPSGWGGPPSAMGGPPSGMGGPPSGPGGAPPAESKEEGGTSAWWLQ